MLPGYVGRLIQWLISRGIADGLLIMDEKNQFIVSDVTHKGVNEFLVKVNDPIQLASVTHVKKDSSQLRIHLSALFKI